eukprot:1577177-Heterocapsa_arctica.AAC.1
MKGVVTENVLAAFVLWLEEASVGAMRLRSDSEPSVRALAGQLAARSRGRDAGAAVVESSRTKSSGSLGGVERYAQTVTGLLRTHILDAQSRWSRRIAASSSLMPWLVRHV